jgi:hypothetical protein|tara:strand:+ start:65 stop:358 length:294 start_codon:yes stop_codon:yes gene_type:complete
MPEREENQKTGTRIHDFRNSLTVFAILLGWFFTIVGLVWTVSSKDTQYDFRITTIERELISLDERLDTAENFRMEIRADLAEIKTDLLWIRKELERR